MSECVCCSQQVKTVTEKTAEVRNQNNPQANKWKDQVELTNNKEGA